jgi:predicted DNA-binding transcriptional regulator YafY
MPTHNVRDVLARQWTLLRLIPREPRAISAADLHGKLIDQGFTCSRRTVERDLVKLESFGFGLTCDDTAVPNLWHWQKDATMSLPAMSVSDALLLSMVQDYLAPILPPTVTRVLGPQFKIANDLLESANKTNPITAWREKVVSIPATQRLIAPDIAVGLMDEIAHALIHSRRLSVSYNSRSSGKASELTLNPLGLVQRGQLFYLVATSGEYTDVRLYAIHRLNQAKSLYEKMKPVADFSLREYVAKGFADFGQGQEVALRLLIAPDLSDHLEECRLSHDQVIEPTMESVHGITEWLQLKATVTETPQLHWWLRGLGDRVQVVSIEALRPNDQHVKQ